MPRTTDAVRRVATGLIRSGVEAGDRVGLYLPNVPHYVAAYYGIMAAGAVAVNFSPLYTVEELAHQVEDSGTTVLVTLSATALLPNALKVLERSSLERLIVGSVAEALPRVPALAYRLLKRRDIAAMPDDARVTRWTDLTANDGGEALPALDPQAVALLQYTGGTTGSPKGAMLTHANLHANAAQVNDADPLAESAGARPHPGRAALLPRLRQHLCPEPHGPERRLHRHAAALRGGAGR